MKSVNKVILLGHVTRDPELKTIPTGQMVSHFDLATNHVWRDKKGEKKEAAEFHHLIAWGPLAESCAKHIKKGKPLYIEGYLKTSTWEGKDGKKNYKTEVVIDDWSFVGSRESESNDDVEALVTAAARQ